MIAVQENSSQLDSPQTNGKGINSMKISCDREQLLQAFHTVASVAPSRSPKPILQNVKMEVTSDQVMLLATDLEIGVRYEVGGVEIQSPGACVLPVARFGSILRESTDKTLHLECDSTAIIVRGERSQFRLPAENPSEFPQVTRFAEASYFQISARLLRELIRRTIYATENESSRYALGGVKLEFDESTVTAIGTDGRRLAKMTGPVVKTGEHHEFDQITIVPTRGLSLIERAVDPGDAEVQVTVKENEFLVQSPRATISARLLEGRFPEWRKVFPEGTGHGMKIDLAIGTTLSAVRQAAIVTSEDSRGVDFTFGDGMLVLSGRAAEVGQSRIELPIGYDGHEMTVTLDPRFVIDFLKVLDADKTFHFEVKDAESAAVCKTDDGYGYVIMPLSRDR